MPIGEFAPCRRTALLALSALVEAHHGEPRAEAEARQLRRLIEAGAMPAGATVRLVKLAQEALAT